MMTVYKFEQFLIICYTYVVEANIDMFRSPVHLASFDHFDRALVIHISNGVSTGRQSAIPYFSSIFLAYFTCDRDIPVLDLLISMPRASFSSFIALFQLGSSLQDSYVSGISS
ncbi:Mediator of RNA polymerase II transcription subunit 12 [Frankliniella fusca]|uniref:Mediator of RNA polymerase II transcription subunit 12 n=1 Tax=Frankliniella fusca TaxID=407009 RepID=A0AAE1GZ98_9NEOP|nr:Mediator of RNA polymerase II transcription subunit 12 [Frankliniella fusca]